MQMQDQSQRIIMDIAEGQREAALLAKTQGLYDA